VLGTWLLEAQIRLVHEDRLRTSARRAVPQHYGSFAGWRRQIGSRHPRFSS
jgi:hypothetical protein